MGPHSVTSDTCSTGSKTCQCPMCYHSLSNPCQDCGCPSNKSNASSSLSLNNMRQRLPQISGNGTTAEYFSPSSDYYSLSPASPTPGQVPGVSGQGGHVSGHHESREAWSQPIYAKIVKSKQEHEGREAVMTLLITSMMIKIS